LLPQSGSFTSVEIMLVIVTLFLSSSNSAVNVFDGVDPIISPFSENFISLNQFFGYFDIKLCLSK